MSDTNQENVPPKIVREISEDGHPIISREMFINFAQARLRAAQALNQENNHKDATQKAKDTWGLTELEKNLELYFNSEQDLAAENTFKQAKEKYVRDKKEAKEGINLANIFDQYGHMDKESIERYERDYQLEIQKAEKEFNAAFDAFYHHNMEKLQKVNRLLVHYVDAEAKKPAAVMKKIHTKANHLRALEVRAIQENHYKVSELAVTSSHIPEGELTSSQKALYQETYGKPVPNQGQHYTNPSTIRDKFQVGQANALRTEIKVGNKVVFKGHRHGSPSVLKIDNEAERQYRTMQNVRQTMAVAAKEKIEALKLEKAELEGLQRNRKLLPIENARLTELNAILVLKTKPIPLDIATMSLLSPVADDNPLMIKKLDDPMKQYRQVNDTRLAYWSLQGREVPLEIPGLEKPVQVTLNSTYMTVGVNAVRGIGTLEAQALVQRVNNRGLNNLVDGFVHDLKPGGNRGNSDVVIRIREIESNEKIQKYVGKIKAFDKTKLDGSYRKLESSNMLLHEYQLRLKEVKRELGFINKALKDPEHKAMNNLEDTEVDEVKKQQSALQAEIKKLNTDIKIARHDRIGALRTIEKEEKKLDGHYKNLAIVRKKAYKKAIPELQAQLNKIQGNPISEALKSDKNFQKIRLFVDTLDTFYNQPQPGIKRLIQQKLAAREKSQILKKLEKETDPDKQLILAEKAKAIQQKMDSLNKGNYQFQARFALLAQHMDNFVEWFCKSGEDRTGLLNEHIEAFCIFIEKNGHAPRWNNEADNQKFHDIMPHVHNGSPNRETNAANDDGPGLKVSDADFEMRSLSYYTDKKLANLAPASSKFKGVAPIPVIIAELAKIPQNTASAIATDPKASHAEKRRIQSKKPLPPLPVQNPTVIFRSENAVSLAVKPNSDTDPNSSKDQRRKSAPK